MKSVSNEFYEKLRCIKETNAIITYKSNKGTYILTTENNDYIATEINNLIGTEKGIVELEDIVSLERKFSVNMLKTVAKAITINSKTKIPKGTWINLKIGVLVNNAYEYEDEGNFYILEEPTYEADTETYTMIGYDKMYESMIKFDTLNIEFPIKVKNLVYEICRKFDWGVTRYSIESMANANSIIEKNVFDNQNLTYRDILDDVSTVAGGSLMFNVNNSLEYKSPLDTLFQEEVNDENIENINASIIDSYGPVNKLIITTGVNVTLAQKEDKDSINQNGETIFNINENRILNYNTDNFIDELFNAIKGLEYSLYDLGTMGLLIYEPLDGFKISHNNKEYKCLMLNSDLRMTSGLKENISAQKPTINQNQYTSASDDVDTKKTKNAYISLDKANAQLVLKVDSNGKIASVRLDGDADNGSVVEINANQINLTAEDILNLISNNTINLTSKNISITSDNFNVAEDGTMNCSNANITGGQIHIIGEKNVASMWVKDKNSQGYTYIYPNQIDITDGVSSCVAEPSVLNVWTLSDDIVPEIIVSGTNGHYSSMSPTAVNSENFNNISLLEKKTNIKAFDNALDIINNTDIYYFNYKNDNSNKNRIGLIIGKGYNYSKEITNDDNTSVNLYSMTSVCFKAIKEQQEQIELLKKQLNDTISIIKEK